jgi:sulfate permease, SulP family
MDEDSPDAESAEEGRGAEDLRTPTDAASESDAPAEVDQPGLGELRHAVANYAAEHLPGPPAPRRDGIAGLSVAVANVPDGLANGLLVGVNPIFGLYATMVGPLVGGLLSSTRLMVVTATAAASLTAGQALAPLAPEDRESALVLLVVLVGLLQIVAGVLGLGRLTRFVSFSVTTGFLTGVAVLLVLSQLPTLAGYDAEGANRIAQTIDLIANLDEIDVGALGVGALALLLALLLPRTPLGDAGRLVAVVVPSLALVFLGLEQVETVRDLGEIPRGFPTPVLPPLVNLVDVFTGAVAVALVILVQGSGVSQNVPNPDGSRSRMSRDFLAQGAANLVSGFFRGLPVGGSVTATALNVVSGARTRWAGIFAGLTMVAIVVAVPGLIGHVAMPALGALLILVGISAVKPSEVRTVWYTGWPSRLAGGTTFLAMLFLPIQAAVAFGVVLSALLYVTRSSTDISVVELVEGENGLIAERSPRRELQSNAVTVLDVYGHLFYAGARTLERLLPRPHGAHRLAVIMRLRGRSTVGATLVEVLARYADELDRAGGRLYLTGISEDVHRQIVQMKKLGLSGSVRIYEATSLRGESTRHAQSDAKAWLTGHGTSDEEDGGSADYSEAE